MLKEVRAGMGLGDPVGREPGYVSSSVEDAAR